MSLKKLQAQYLYYQQAFYQLPTIKTILADGMQET